MAVHQSTCLMCQTTNKLRKLLSDSQRPPGFKSCWLWALSTIKQDVIPSSGYKLNTHSIVIIY
jgi:hypothetical protein